MLVLEKQRLAHHQLRKTVSATLPGGLRSALYPPFFSFIFFSSPPPNFLLSMFHCYLVSPLDSVQMISFSLSGSQERESLDAEKFSSVYL